MASSSSPAIEDAAADLLSIAFRLFVEQGYAAVTLDQVAAGAGVAVSALNRQYRDKATLLTAALKANAPIEPLKAVLLDASAPDAETLVRDATHAMVKAVSEHQGYFDLAVIDNQLNNGSALQALTMALLPAALSFLNKVTATKQLRPMPTPVLARTFIAMLIGFIASERAMPAMVEVLMRAFPRKGWLDAMVDLLLYGILEDDQR